MGNRKTVLSLFARLLIAVTVVISITDAIEYYHVKKNPGMLTLPFLILVIIITIIPIAVNLWYWLVFKKQGSQK
jgi:hypothetical protein